MWRYAISALLKGGIYMDFLARLPEIAKAIADMFVEIFASVSAIFYTPGTPAVGDAPATAGSLTFIGVLCLVVLFIGLCLVIANWVRSLISRR